MTRRWDLPSGWAWAAFESVAQVEADLVDPAAHLDAPHIAPNHIESGTGKLLAFRSIREDGVTSPKHRFGAGRILYSKIRPYLAKAAAVDFDGLCSADMYPIRPEVERGFLHRWLISPMFTEWASESQGRTLLPKINQVALAAKPVPVAPLNEQKRIVAKIEALQARSDAARAALDAIPPLLEKFRQSVLAAAFRGDLTRKWREAHPDVEPASALLERIRAERRRRWEAGNPRKAVAEAAFSGLSDAPAVTRFGDVAAIGWALAPLDSLVDPIRGIPYGIVKTGDPIPGGVPTVRCGDIKRFAIDIDALKRVAPELHAQYRRTELAGGEVLVAIRGTVGATAVAPATMAGMNISREVAMVPPLPGLDSKYLMYALASPAGQALMHGQVKGVAQSGINLADLRMLHIPLPPEPEQLAIVDAVESLLRGIDDFERRLATKLAGLDTLDQAVLAKAFRGELVPQDPDDEPASVLLERIRREREAAAAAPKAGRRRRADAGTER